MKDRKLGDEWADWNGEANNPDALNVDEKPGTFITLSAVLIICCLAMFPVALYMVSPRIEQLSPAAAPVISYALFWMGLLAVLLVVAWGISVLKFRKSLFPLRWVEKGILLILPKTVWLGSRLGISRDRVGNSFIKTHNRIIRAYAGKFNPERPLILLPRCLKPDIRRDINQATANGPFRIVTAVGGEEARKAIFEYRPTFILAVACERDLMSGLKDVAAKLPVLAIPNRRPEGPCKNTSIPIEEFMEAIAFIKDDIRKAKSKKPR
ncbi:MAG: DUF116 domain-containing protein [Nitrospiraceae bacterium]|nr:DUF116 domain-containing protein [Nitrospiraceae bacterium]